MANSTDTYWSVDGISLQTFAFDIETVGGDRMAPPPLRGGNQLVPNRAGQRWLPKVVDSRTITLGMWVIGVDEDGFAPTTGSNARKFDENFRKLRNLLWTPDREVTLTKRFYDGGVLKTASAQAQFSGGLNPRMNGRARGVFTVDLFLADPYFYGNEVTTNLTSASQVVTVGGDGVTTAITLDIAGPRVNPKVRNNTRGVEVEYRAGMVTGDTVAINVKDFTSVTDPASGPAYASVGDIRHAGAVEWLELQPGANTIQVSATSGSGLIVMKHREAWL